MNHGNPLLHARLSLGEGLMQGVSYRKLTGEVTWRPNSLSIKDLEFQALGGSITGNGSWKKNGTQTAQFTLSPDIRGVDLKALLAVLAPGLFQARGRIPEPQGHDEGRRLELGER